MLSVAGFRVQVPCLVSMWSSCLVRRAVHLEARLVKGETSEGLQQPLSPKYLVHHGTVSTCHDAGRFFPRTFPQAHSSLPQSPPESLAACPATSMRFWETIATHCVSATGQAPLLLVKPLPYKRRMSRWAGWGINSSVAPKRQKKHFRVQRQAPRVI